MTEDRDTPEGLAYALTAYAIWGFLPLYMKMLGHLSPAEIVAHRVLWSVSVALTPPSLRACDLRVRG